VSEYLDYDGYPTEEALGIIRLWDVVRGEDDNYDSMDARCRGLFYFIESIWKYASDGYFDYNEDGVYFLSTAGWSGNESIIEAMESNVLLQGLCWKASRAGGRYIYTLPRSRYKVDVDFKVTKRKEMENEQVDN